MLVARWVHSPPFSRRGGCAINKKIPFLSGADGVVSNFKQNMVRYADVYKEATRPFTGFLINASPYRARASRPSAPQRNGIFLLRRSHPALKTVRIPEGTVIDSGRSS